MKDEAIRLGRVGAVIHTDGSVSLRLAHSQHVQKIPVQDMRWFFETWLAALVAAAVRD